MGVSNSEETDEGIDIIFISMSSWDNDISSAALSLAKEFSKRNRVFYYDNPFTIKDFIADFRQPKIRNRLLRFFLSKFRYQFLPDLGPRFYAVTPPLTLPINFLPKGRIYRFFLTINRLIVEKNLDSLLKKYQIKRYIFFNSYNPFYHAITPKKLPPVLSVYQSRDDISQITYGSKHGIILEKEAIIDSDISFATSRALTRKLQVFTDSQVFHLPNAVNLSSFNHQKFDNQRPIDISHIRHEIICYIGNLDQRVDYQLLQQIAQEHSDKILLLIGPRNDQNHHQIDFDELDNVLFLGPKPHDQLYSYLQFSSCAIIPFVKNELTASIYPLKINEYLAMGKPVVATDFSEDVRNFDNVCYISSDHDSFSKLVGKVVNQNQEESLVKKRIDFANNNSWKDRVSSFWDFAKPHLKYH